MTFTRPRRAGVAAGVLAALLAGGTGCSSLPDLPGTGTPPPVPTPVPSASADAADPDRGGSTQAGRLLDWPRTEVAGVDLPGRLRPLIETYTDTRGTATVTTQTFDAGPVDASELVAWVVDHNSGWRWQTSSPDPTVLRVVGRRPGEVATVDVLIGNDLDVGTLVRMLHTSR